MILTATTRWEVIKYIGVIILIARYELSLYHDTWYSRSHCKYIKPPGIGNTGLMRPRCDNIYPCIEFPIQQQKIPEGININDCECKFVNDHIEIFNRHKLERFYPLEIIYVY